MKMCSEVFQFEKELKWENPGPGIRRQIMGYDEQLMMVKVQFEKGAVGTMHEHHHSQATYVVRADNRWHFFSSDQRFARG